MTAAARLLVSLATLTWLASASVSAQRPQTREGFWIGFGFGAGSAGLSCSTSFDPDCANQSRETGFTGYLKIGGTLTPKVLLGGESTGWTKSDSAGTTFQLGTLVAAAYFYPAPATGFFLKGGPGFAVYRESNDTAGSASGTGFGFLLGAGYDIRVSKNISITPAVNFLWGSIGDISSGGLSTQGLGLKENVFDFQLGITFH